MKFLVTGANGFLGQGVVTELLDSGHKVVATDITVENIDSRAVRIEADIFEGSNSIFFDDIDVLIHLAWKN
ncbi:TPA: NAD-dependent epimerase/dehydratase family protein, partial [Streptococcus suis]